MGSTRVRTAPQKCVEWVKKTSKKQQKNSQKTANMRQTNSEKNGKKTRFFEIF